MEEKSHGESSGSAGKLRFAEENPAYNFFIGQNAGYRLRNSILEAKNSIMVISPYISEPEIEILREKILGGVPDITVVTSASEDNLQKPSQLNALKKLIHRERQKNDGGYEYRTISNCNILFLKEDRVHAKLYVIDDEIAYSGSLNFTRNGMSENYETCITIKNPGVVKGLGKFINDVFRYTLPKWDIAELGKKIYEKEKER